MGQKTQQNNFVLQKLHCTLNSSSLQLKNTTTYLQRHTVINIYNRLTYLTETNVLLRSLFKSHQQKVAVDQILALTFFQ